MNSSNGYINHLGVNPEAENANGLRAFAILGQFLEEDGWHPQQVENRYVYTMHYSGQNGTVRCYAQVRVDLEQFMFYAVVPVKAQSETLSAVSEYLNRANFGMRIGNFELDYSDGEVRYKSSLDFEGQELSPTLIKHAIYPAVQTTDRYMPSLLSVIYGGKTPLDAIIEVEGTEEE